MRPALYPVLFGNRLRPVLDLLFTSGVLDPRITFSRGTLATLTNAAGNVAYAPHNFALWSEDLTGAGWAGGTATSVPGAGRSGGNATRIQLPSGMARDFNAAPGTTNSITSSVGCWIKSNTGSPQTVRLKNTHAAVADYFSPDLTVTTTWQFFSFTQVFGPSSGTGYALVGIITNVANTSADILVSEFQSNVGPLQPYYPTTSAAYHGPRFTYDPITHASLGLLIEEQRTNLLKYSEQFDNAAWVKGVNNTSVTANAATSPDGTISADKLIETASTGIHAVAQNASAGTYDFSVFLKAAERRYAGFAGAISANDYVVFDLQSGTITQNGSGVTNAKIEGYGSGWYRCSGVCTFNTGGAYIYLVTSGTPGYVPTYAGDGTSGIYVWGAQLEAGAFATSYIPTTSATVTRAADSATMTGANFSSWFNAPQGTFVVEGTKPTGLPGVCIAYEALSAARGSGDIISADINDKWVYQSSGFATEAALSQSWTSGTLSKQAGSYSTNNFKACLNGGTVLTDSVGTVTAGINQLRIGDNGAGNHTINIPIARLRYYNTALTNAQLQALTT